jgi:multiple sugar transport system substrate-binding protein
MAGKIAFTRTGEHPLPGDSTKHRCKDTAIKMMPRGPAGRNLALTFVMNWAVPVDGKHQKEARALVACIMSKDKFTAYMTGSFQQAVPLFKNLLNNDYWNNADGKVIVETVKLARPVGWPGPTTPAAAEVISSNVLTDMMTRVIVDKVTPEKAVEEADKRIKEIYDRLPPK